MCLDNAKTKPIYVITEGFFDSYEDDYIIGYFTEKYKAERFVEEMNEKNRNKGLVYVMQEICEL